jgi:hypothetical protein
VTGWVQVGSPLWQATGSRRRTAMKFNARGKAASAAKVFLATAMVAVPLTSLASAADARVSSADRNTNSAGAGCGILQDNWDQGAKDLSNASTQADYDRIKGGMIATLHDWEAFCKGNYGSIMFRRSTGVGTIGIGVGAGLNALEVPSSGNDILGQTSGTDTVVPRPS